MKQLLSLFLFLLPCLAWAQYPSNGNQKITLGEQTTSDGLIWRGVASIDTVTATSKITRANKQDTSAFILLDTVTNLLWHYKTTSNGWIQAGGSTLDTATMLLPYYRSGRTAIIQASDVPTLNQNTTGSAATLTTSRTFQTNLASTSTASFNGSANVTPGVTGTLPVANGGTNTSTAFTQGSVLFAGANGTYTQDNSNLFWNNTSKRLGIGTSSPGYPIHIYSTGTTPAILRISNAGSSVTSYAEFALETNTGFASFFKNSSTNTEYGGVGALNFGTVQNENVAIMSDNTIRLLITGSGNIGIGTLTPQSGYRLHVVDSVYVGGRVSAAGYTTRSDYDLKDEIESINYGLKEVIQMQPVKYTYKSNGEQQLGFIAQDIGTLIPESVHFDEFMGVDYQSIIPILTKAIQEQNLLIKALEQRILILENK